MFQGHAVNFLLTVMKMKGCSLSGWILCTFKHLIKHSLNLLNVKCCCFLRGSLNIEIGANVRSAGVWAASTNAADDGGREAVNG